MSKNLNIKELNIRELDLDMFHPNSKTVASQNSDGFACTILGRPGVGKTSLIKYLAYYKKDIIPTAMVFSGTEDSCEQYGKIFPSSFVYNKLDISKVEDFIRRQKLAKKNDVENPRCLLLIDDCTDDPKILKHKVFQSLFKNGRHYKMLFILSMQYCMDIAPSIRTCISSSIIFKDSNLKNRKSLWENYAGVFPDFRQFCEAMDQLTTDFHAMVIYNKGQSNNIEECVFYIKVDPNAIPDDFQFGCYEYIDHHNQRYNPDYVDPVIV